MNQTFDLKRFSLLFIKHTADNYKTYLMSFFVLLGVLFLAMGFIAYVSGGVVAEKAQIPFFIFVLLIAGSIFTSIVFADLGNKRKAIAILTLPASHFEKYLIGWIYSFVIFQLLFIPAFYLTVMLINQLGSINASVEDSKLLNIFSNENKVYIVFYLYAILHAVCLWGSIFFKKHQFIKTAFLFFISIFVLVFLNLKFIRALISKDAIVAMPFGGLKFQTDGNFWDLQLPDEKNVYILIPLCITVGILWACSFYRLKEKEV